MFQRYREPITMSTLHRVMKLALCVLPLCWLCSTAIAHPSDPEFAPLLRDRKVDELEKRASQRIAANPSDEAAIWVYGYLETPDVVKQETAIAFAEACVAALPASAKCHYALAVASLRRALAKGRLAGLPLVPKARDSLIKSVELDPKDFQSRWDLNRFYLEAPGIAGGSARSAIANSEDHGKVKPGEGQLLLAQVYVNQREFEKAETALVSAVVDGDLLAMQWRTSTWINLGLGLMNASKPEAARSLFERRIADDEGNHLWHYWLARVHFRLNALNPAIAALERAMKIKADDVDTQFLAGHVYQAKGDTPNAIAAFEKVMALSPSGPTGPAGQLAAASKERLEALRK